MWLPLQVKTCTMVFDESTVYGSRTGWHQCLLITASDKNNVFWKSKGWRTGVVSGASMVPRSEMVKVERSCRGFASEAKLTRVQELKQVRWVQIFSDLFSAKYGIPSPHHTNCLGISWKVFFDAEIRYCHFHIWEVLQGIIQSMIPSIIWFIIYLSELKFEKLAWNMLPDSTWLEAALLRKWWPLWLILLTTSTSSWTSWGSMDGLQPPLWMKCLGATNGLLERFVIMPMKPPLWGRSSTTRFSPWPEMENSGYLVFPTFWMWSRSWKKVEGPMARPSMMFAPHWLMGALSSNRPSLTCGRSRMKGTKMKQHFDSNCLKILPPC